MRSLRWHWVGAAIETHDHPKQESKDEQRNDGDDWQQDRVVDPFGILAVFSELFLEIDFLWLRHANAVLIIGTHGGVAGQRAIH